MGPCMELGVLVVEDVPGYFEHFMTVEVRTKSLVWCCTPPPLPFPPFRPLGRY